MTPQEIFDRLAAPFASAEVAWRVGPTNERTKEADEPLKGQCLCYIDARSVMDRLDVVCGVDGWQCNYTPGVGTSIVCNIAIKFPVFAKQGDANVQVGHEWVWKGDGAGPSDTEPEKGALSDAFKRAGVRWGIGRYLYELRAPWVELVRKGKTALIPKDIYPKLDKLHDDYARRLFAPKEQA